MQIPSMDAWFEKSAGLQGVFMRAGSALLWIVFVIELISRIESGRIAYIVSGAGMLCWLTALTISPVCWALVDAKPGSSSRKAMQAMLLFGILLHIAGVLARLHGVVAGFEAV